MIINGNLVQFGITVVAIVLLTFILVLLRAFGSF